MAARQQLNGFAKNPGGTNKIYLRGAGRDGRLRCVTLSSLPSTPQRFSPKQLFTNRTRHRGATQTEDGITDGMPSKSITSAENLRDFVAGVPGVAAFLQRPGFTQRL